MNPKLTVCILTKNGAKDLAVLLKQVSFADEILVVDDNSTDETVAMAKKAGARVYIRSLNGDFSKQRNFALKQADKGYVFFVDQDERISQELASEIKKEMSAPEFDGYYLERRDIFKGREVKHGEAGRMQLLRLGKKGAGWWERPVHEVWHIPKPGIIRPPIIHLAHQDKADFRRKVDTYAYTEAKYRFENDELWSLWQSLVFPMGKFIQNYIWRLGFLDGNAGLIYALMMSRHSFMVRRNLYKLYYPYPKPEPYLEKGFKGLFYLFLMSLAGYQLTRWQINDVLAVYGFELLMGLIIILGLAISVRRKNWRWPNWAMGLGVFWLGLGLSLVVNFWLLSHKDWLMASLYWWRLAFYLVFMLVITNIFRLKVILVPPVRWLIYLGSVIAVLGLGQYLFWPDLRWLYALGWDDHLFRLVSTLLDPGFTGLILGLTLLLFISYPLPYRKAGWIMVAIAMLLTYARSAFGAYLIGDWVVGLMTHRTKASLGRTVLLLAAMIFLPRPGGEGVRLERTYSIEARAKSVITAWDIFVQKPIFGIGYNAYRVYTQPVVTELVRPVHPSGPDNSYLYILVTGGIVGMLGFLFLAGVMIKTAWGQPMLSASLVTMAISGMGNNSLFYPLILVWTGLLLANNRLDNWELIRANKRH